MVYLEYNDLNDLYHNFSRLPSKPEFENYSEDTGSIGATVYLNNIVLKSKSFDFNMDLSYLNYTKVKWNTLIKKYLNKESYFDLKDRLINSTAKTLTFNFNIHISRSTDTDKTKNIDSCLVAMVFVRGKNSGKWTTVNIYYRVAEVYKKFAVDLILFNRMFNDLPNLDLKEIYFHFPMAFFSCFILAELIGGELFDISEFESENNFTCFKIKKFYDKFYGENSVQSNYHAIQRKQLMKLNKVKLESIPIDSLTIFNGYIETKLW